MPPESEILTGSSLAQLQLENQRLRRAVEELSILNDLATAIGGTNDPTEIMQIIVKRSLKTVHAEQGVITLIDEEHNRDPLSTFVRSMSSSSEHRAIHPDESILGWIMTYHRPLVVNDPAKDPRFQGTRWDETVRSIICVPMVARSKLVGTLTIYNKKDEGGFTEADQRLVSILAAQSAQVLENARLHEEESALQQIQEELRLANQIQSKLLPQDMPLLPGYDLAGTSSPARSVGGDFFDFVPMDENELCFWVGDVAGKGLPAALTMATIQATLRGDTAATHDVARILSRANKYLCSNTTRSTFVTLFLGILDATKHEVSFGNAGHNRPLLIRNGEAVTLDYGDLVLGFAEDVEFSVQKIELQPEDVLVVYSDGINEAMNMRREQFGEHRLIETLSAIRATSASNMVNAVVEQVQNHAGNAPQADDLTIAVIKRLAGN